MLFWVYNSCRSSTCENGNQSHVNDRWWAFRRGCKYEQPCHKPLEKTRNYLKITNLHLVHYLWLWRAREMTAHWALRRSRWSSAEIYPVPAASLFLLCCPLGQQAQAAPKAEEVLLASGDTDHQCGSGYLLERCPLLHSYHSVWRWREEHVTGQMWAAAVLLWHARSRTAAAGWRIYRLQSWRRNKSLSIKDIRRD